MDKEPKEEEILLTDRASYLEAFKKEYRALVDKYGWDVGAILRVIDQTGTVQAVPTFIDISEMKRPKE